jgi:hypothetical protein
MDKNRLEEIKAIEQVATQGPWLFNKYYDPFELRSPNGVRVMSVNMQEAFSFERIEDREFIEKARQIVPELLNEAERVAEVVNRAKFVIRYADTLLRGPKEGESDTDDAAIYSLTWLREALEDYDKDTGAKS